MTQRARSAISRRSQRAFWLDLTALGVLVDDRAHHLGVEEVKRPAAVTETAARVLVLPTGRLYDAVEAHELAYEHSNALDRFR